MAIETANQHKNYLDVIRVLGCVFVIFIHISGNFNNDILQFNTKTYYIVQFLRVIALMAVPLFVMVSGCVNLGRPLAKTRLKLKIFNLARLYMVWLLIPLPILIISNSWMDFSWDTVKFIMENLANYSYHLWYLLMLIGLYLLTPVLNRFIKTKHILMYIIKIYFVSLIILTVVDVLRVFNILNLQVYVMDYRFIFPVFLGYFLLGYYIDHYNIKIKLKNLIIATCISLLLIIFITAFLPMIVMKPIKFDYRNTIIYFVLAPVLFLLIKKKINIRTKLINSISKHSFGIYLIHLLYVNILYFNLLKYIPLHPLILIPVSTVFVLSLSYITVYILSKIPLIKKLVS